MAKYILKFDTTSDFVASRDGGEMVYPNVSYCDDTEGMHYNEAVCFIGGNTVPFKAGMTWREFIYSEYNVENYSLFQDAYNGRYYIRAGALQLYDDQKRRYAEADDLIVENASYSIAGGSND